MWDHITDTAVPISSIKDKKLRHLRLTASRKAVTAILDAVAPDVAASIDNDEERSAHQIWKLLEDHYSKGMVIQPYILLTELVQLSQIGGVGEFISNIEHISTESSLMGKPIGPDIKLGCQGMRRSQASHSPKSNQEPVCWHCDETSHISPECPNRQGNMGRRKRGGRGNGPGKGGGNGSNAGVAGQALAIMTMGVTADPAHDRWIWDTGADVHICKDKSLMSNLSKTAGTITRLCSGVLCQDGEGRDCIMVSEGQHRLQVARSTEHDDRLYLNQALNAPSSAAVKSPSQVLQAASKADELEIWKTWHCRFGHASLDRVRKSLQATGVNAGPIPKHFSCDTCNANKFARPPFGKGHNKTKNKLNIVVSNVQGPMPVPSLGGAQYALTITDVHTRCTWAFPIATKDAALSVIGRWLEEVKEEVGHYPMVFHSDGGGEYTSTAFRKMLCQRGIVQQTTAPYSPQQNGVSERLNLTIMNVVRPMLSAAGLPDSFWAEATCHANWIKNHTYSKSVKNIPYTLWTGAQPQLDILKSFSTIVWAQDLQRGRYKSKLSPRTVKCVWVGVDDMACAAHCCIDLNDYIKVYTTRNVKFERKMLSDAIIDADNYQPYQQPQVCQAQLDLEVELELADPDPLYDNDESDDDSDDSSLTSVPSTASPLMEEDDPSDFQVQYLATVEVLASPDASIEEHELELDTNTQRDAVLHNLALSIIQPPLAANRMAYDLVSLAGVDPQISNDDPTTVPQAKASPNWPKWEEAINIELDSLVNTSTWTIVNLPQGRKPISARWVFKTKQDADNNISKFKACLVACGYSQVHGVDYHNTYSPMVSITCLQMVMCYGIKHGYRICQLDFVAAYLNGELRDVDIYMVLSPVFEDRFKQSPQSVCNLKKAQYELKQSGLYVDDLIIVGVDSDVDHMITTICAQFKITGGDDAEWCLSVHIQQSQDRSTVSLGQTSYIDTILERFSMTRANPVKTPLDPSAVNLSPKDASHKTLNKAQTTVYQQMIGSVMYLMTSTHPDLAFVVGNLTKYLSLPTTVHLNQARHLLRYISYTHSNRLTYLLNNNNKEPLAYSDTDHAGSWKENPYSTSGFVLTLFGGATAWKSCWQRIISTSTAEAEVVALSDACHNIDWLIDIVKGLGFIGNGDAGVVLHTDNQAAQQVTSSDGPQQNKALTLCAA
ncbi:uncharacterized protein UHOD_12086 [Ustilago sp. UG-2017b]|nr:uncharacterized protein UHOD_12086 [Ustilago sp. UG-2017b]